MEEKKLLTLVSPDGRKTTVEYIAEINLDNNRYLVITPELEESTSYQCNVVKLKKEGSNDVIEDIKDDDEYERVVSEINRILLAEGE